MYYTCNIQHAGGYTRVQESLFQGIGPYPNFDFPSNRLARAFVIPMNNHEASLIVAPPQSFSMLITEVKSPILSMYM